MATEQEIVEKYNRLEAELHNEFFETIDKDRRLKADKEASEFNQRFAQLEQDRIAELAAIGIVYNIPPSPARDLAAEIDEIKARLERLEESKLAQDLVET